MRDITVYKCNVCDREVQLVRKPQTIETVGKCIITENCRGQLYIEKLIQTSEPRIKRTPDEVGVDNFYARPKLRKFTQPYNKDNWYINHQLETFPIISVYSDDDDQTPISDLNYEIELVDNNTVILQFNAPTSGTAELYVREVAPVESVVAAQITDEVFSPVSTNLLTGTITLALTETILDELAEADTPDVVRIKFTDANKQILFGTFDLESTNTNSPWNSVNKVVYKNKSYFLKTINIFSSGYNAALISNGTTAEILKSDNSQFDSNQVIALLAQDPFDPADIITNEIVEIDKINSSTNILFFDNDELFCNNNAKTSTFPNLLLS